MTSRADEKAGRASGDPLQRRRGRPAPGVRTRPLQGSDTVTTARLQRRYLPRGLFPSLGQRFVARWHATFVDCPAGWGRVAVDEHGEVVGFAVVALDQQQYVVDVLARHGIAMAGAGARGLLARPRVLARFVRTRLGRYVRRLAPMALRGRRLPAGGGPTAAPSSPDGRDAVGVVHAVVVDESARGAGVARELLTAAEEACRAHGTPRMALVTGADEDGEDGAVGLYDRLGWTRAGTHVRDGHRVMEFHRRLARSPEAGGADPVTDREDRHPEH